MQDLVLFEKELSRLRLQLPELADCPNRERTVSDGHYFWEDVEEKNGWRLQQNLITGLSRILDEHNIRKAWGSAGVMKEKFRRLTRKEFPEKGDVLGITREKALGIYDHYAVYIGNGRVIHYAGMNGDFSDRIVIHEASMEEFLKEDKDYFVLYFGGDGRCPQKIHSSTSFWRPDIIEPRIEWAKHAEKTLYSPGETVQRAKSRLGEEEYHLAINNCEHFALWCKTGVSQSYQVKRAVNGVTRGHALLRILLDS
ncbi:MAG: phosphatidylcholine--retinol O-acyltransferase [Lachnospiraceae bacterium]|nr:phosphatidylcholine--retinol O-acyltransferase [Lachnospiraceae bacterium]